MKIQINQINPKTLDFNFNKELIIDSLRNLNGDDTLSIFPELSVSGSFLYDAISYNDTFISATEVCDNILLEKKDAIFGTPLMIENKKYNALVMVKNGEVLALSTKKNVSEFDNGFQIGKGIEIVNYNSKTLGFGFLEDLRDFASEKRELDYLIICSNYIFHHSSQKDLYSELVILARKLQTPILFCNRTGAEGGYVFSGSSFVLNKRGEIIFLATSFNSSFQKNNSSFHFIESSFQKAIMQSPDSKLKNIYNALSIALRDYFQKNGINKAILGLSGGIDSAVVVAIAVNALGKENVIGLIMPSEYSSEHSIKDALDSAKNLDIEHYIIPIKEFYDTCVNRYNDIFKINEFNVAEENLQSRLRCLTLMWYANKTGAGLLNTTNKSEAAVGYGTLYGDTSGAISILADLYKTEVWELARWINENWHKAKNEEIKLPIPINSIIKPPSAELSPNQKDTDSLPEYTVLDRILKEHLENKLSEKEIEEAFDSEGLNVERDIIARVIKLIKINEWKRRQCPMVVKLTKHSFGLDRKYPIS